MMPTRHSKKRSIGLMGASTSRRADSASKKIPEGQIKSDGLTAELPPLLLREFAKTTRGLGERLRVTIHLPAGLILEFGPAEPELDEPFAVHSDETAREPKSVGSDPFGSRRAAGSRTSPARRMRTRRPRSSGRKA